MEVRNFKVNGLGQKIELNDLSCGIFCGSGGPVGMSIDMWARPDVISGKKKGSASLHMSMDDARELIVKMTRLIEENEK